MLDAIVPAARAFIAGGFDLAARAAADGAEATAAMPARRGRARNVENGGIGCVDPGAASVVLILDVLRENCR